MPRVATTPVQVRLPDPVNEFLAGLAAERHESKTQIVVEALDLLRDHLREAQMEAGYREIGDSHLELVAAMQPLVAEALPE
jgi:predicted transcriptional regulator